MVALRVRPRAGGQGLQAELAVEVELAPAQGDEPPHKETGRATEPVGAGGPSPARARRAEPAPSARRSGRSG